MLYVFSHISQFSRNAARRPLKLMGLRCDASDGRNHGFRSILERAGTSGGAAADELGDVAAAGAPEVLVRPQDHRVGLPGDVALEGPLSLAGAAGSETLTQAVNPALDRQRASGGGVRDQGGLGEVGEAAGAAFRPGALVDGGQPRALALDLVLRLGRLERPADAIGGADV
jgi:hypothetical protein